MKHKPGARHTDVDALTRQQLPSCSPYGEDPIELLYGTRNPLNFPEAFSILATRSVNVADPYSKPLFSDDASLADFDDITTTHDEATMAFDFPAIHWDSVPWSEKEAMMKHKEKPNPEDFFWPDNTFSYDEIVLIDLDLLPATESLTSPVTSPSHPILDDDPSVPSPPPKPWFNCEADKEAWTLKDFVKVQSVLDDAPFESAKKSKKAMQINDIWIVRGKGSDRDRIIVPESLKAFVIGTHHNLPMAGHIGVRRTTKAISNNYYWRGMSSDIRRWIKACSACGTRKTSRTIHAGITEPVLSTFRNELWAIDIVGPLLVTDKGNRYLVTMIDCASRWNEAAATATFTEEEIADCIHAWICRRGRPEKIISDQGKSLISKAIKLLCRRWGIRDIETGGYNAKANGIIERNHRFLLAALSILFDRRSPNWDAYIDPALFCYRVSIAVSTGFSPYFLEHGDQPNLPSSLNMPLEYQSNSNYIERTALKLHEAWEPVNFSLKLLAATT